MGLSKNKSRKSQTQRNNEKHFKSQLAQLFDVAHAEVKNKIKISEDWNFLVDQRGPWKMIMAGEDLSFKQQQERIAARAAAESQRRKRSLAEVSGAVNVATVEAMEPSSSSSESNCDDEPSTISRYQQSILKCEGESSSTTSLCPQNAQKLDPRQVIDDKQFGAALDRTNTSSRQALHIAASALRAAGVDVDAMTLSATSIHGARKAGRVATGVDIKNKFKPTTPVIIHFDGKLLPDYDGEKFERLPIVVSGMGFEKLLAIPRLPSGTGKVMANVVIQCLDQWPNVKDWVAGLCFDTTASNTGVHWGACTLIQQEWEKSLLFLACRHHMHEVIIGGVFNQFFASCGPDIALFAQFKAQWSSLNHKNYSSINFKADTESDLTQAESAWIAERRDGVVELLHGYLQEKQPRDDYKEFLELCLIILDAIPATEIKFRAPGAYHRARWMGKGIYCLKIYLFRKQFSLSTSCMDCLRRIAIFVVTIYAIHWFKATNAADAPINDLSLLKILETYQSIDYVIAQVALEKLKNHLWYLSEDLISFGFFSDVIATDEKLPMVQALQRPAQKKHLRRAEYKEVSSVHVIKLSDFVTVRSLNLFKSLKLDQSFLQLHPSTWDHQEGFTGAKCIVHNLSVINDCAERAVKLASDFCTSLTKDEDQRQLALQVTEYHRSEVPKANKAYYI